MTQLFLTLHRFFIKNRFVFILFILAVLALGSYSFFHLSLEDDINNVLPEDGDLAKFEQVLNKTSTGNRLLFIIENKEKDIEALLSAGDELHYTLQTINADSLFSEIAIKNDETQFLNLLNAIYADLPYYLEESDLTELNLNETVLRKKLQNKFRTLFTPVGSMLKNSIVNDPLDLSHLALKKLKNLQADDNYQFVNSYLISKDSTSLLGFATVSSQINEGDKKALLHQKIQEEHEIFNENHKEKLYVFGAPIIAQENALRIKKDIMLTVNIAVTLLLLCLAFYYRSIKVLPGFIIPVILGSAAALTFLYFKQNVVSAISLGMGSVLLGTIIDYTLHTLTHLRKTADSEETIQQVAAPILAGSITTSSAFLSLLLIQSKALTDLAIFAASSMIFGAIFSIVVLPIFYKKAFKKISDTPNFIDRKVAYPFHKNKFIIILCLGVVVSALFFLKNIDFEKDLNKLNYMPAYIQEAEIKLNESSNALQSNLIAVVEAKDINTAIYQTEIIEDSLKNSVFDIEQINSITSVLSSKQTKEKRLAAWEKYWTKEKMDTVKKIIEEEATNLGIKVTAFASFFKLLEQPQPSKHIKLNKLSKNYIIYNDKEDKYYSTIIIKLDKNGKKAVHEKLKRLGENIYVLDRSNAIKGLVKQVKESLQKISYLLLCIILIILAVYFKNLELVSLAFLPVALSWLTTLGIMGFFHIDFNMLNIIIVIFIFGLGIDYSIFMLNALVVDYRTGSKTFNTVKTSVLLSAFTTFTGISVLIFAKHPALHSIAAAGMIAILSVFIYAIVILPALFNAVVYARTTKGFEPITYKSVYDTMLSYTSLILGVVIITLTGVVLKLLFFIPIENRKLFYHRIFNYWAKMYIRILYPGKRYAHLNIANETFNEPAVIISNHQSLIDTPYIVSLNPKIILLTKDWVRKNPVFGLGARLADFYSVDGDHHKLLTHLRKKVKQGYSIAVFSEGTRSTSKKLGRLYRGAFQLAYDLELDIVPVIVNGTIDTLHKNQFFGQRRKLQTVIGKRILFEDKSYGDSRLDRYKKIRNAYKSFYRNTVMKNDQIKNYEKQILSNYRYKGAGIYRKAKKELHSFSYFKKIEPLLKNQKITLLINDDLGVLSLSMQVLSFPNPVVLITKNSNFVSNLYLLRNMTIYKSLNHIDLSNIEQVIIFTDGPIKLTDKINNIPSKILIDKSKKTIDILL